MSQVLVTLVMLTALTGCVRTVDSQKKRYFLITVGFSTLFVSDKERDIQAAPEEAVTSLDVTVDPVARTGTLSAER